ncbi:hypothetical protein HF521_020024 [Silurus meridionalis]|uniref:Ig-like domain-containing protein n=1 Tax=Silurus meridionalis TaxID=175797 RepID=A0A8T0BN23_SILME|nr:hypothetical protein HF521_020024 [Silurus meridionalis]
MGLLIIQFVSESDSGDYTCRGQRRDSWRSKISDAVTLTVLAITKPTVRVNPQRSVYTEDTITLSCDLQQSTEWGIFWYKDYQDLQLHNGENANTFNVTVANEGETVYQCRAHRKNYIYYTEHSDPVEIIVRDVRNKNERKEDSNSEEVKDEEDFVVLNPVRGEKVHVHGILEMTPKMPLKSDPLQTEVKALKEEMTLQEEENTINRQELAETQKRMEKMEEILKDTRREMDQTKEIITKVTVLVSQIPVAHAEAKPRPTIRVNPQSSIYTGDTITLSCKLQETTGKNRFFKYSIHFNNYYYTEWSEPVKITIQERPQAVLSVSPQNWLTEGDSVTLSLLDSRPSAETVGLAVGLSLFLLFIVLLILMILLWFYKMKKEKQLESSQTSEQNQRRSGAEDSQSGYTPLQTGEAAAQSSEVTYTQVMKKKKTSRKNGADAELGMNDVTYAEVQLKPIQKVQSAQEKTSVGDDTVYSELHHSMK